MVRLLSNCGIVFGTAAINILSISEYATTDTDPSVSKWVTKWLLPASVRNSAFETRNADPASFPFRASALSCALHLSRQHPLTVR
uniref:Uncharacterized protein n=1 Tax=Hyaloperonospora arabidopsidis (strain Emoy2) TaxID=559515 RepID=M4C1I0_HYAAE